jgi:hypothetical protein
MEYTPELYSLVSNILLAILCDYYKISKKDIQIKNRKREVSNARLIYCHIMFKIRYDKLSMRSMGKPVRLDHAGVLQKLNKMNSIINSRESNIELYYDYLNVQYDLSLELQNHSMTKNIFAELPLMFISLAEPYPYTKLCISCHGKDDECKVCHGTGIMHFNEKDQYYAYLESLDEIEQETDYI